MNKFKQNKKRYSHRQGSTVMEISIKDSSYQVMYSNTININDHKALINFLKVIEKFTGISVKELIAKDLLTSEEWM